MFSSEISDLESFIDSYVTDKGGNTPRQGSRTQSHEDGFPANALPQFNEQPTMPENTGTEIWGQKPGGSEWHASSFNKPQGTLSEHRPKIQERSIQWQQPGFQSQPNYPPAIDAGFVPPDYGQPQDPNHIQAVVTGLIRQNNINKAAQNLPNWVDVSRPPPSFPPAANQGFGQVPGPNQAFGPVHDPNQAFGQVPNNLPSFGEIPNNPNLYYNPQESFPVQEPILQSMTFQRQDPRVPDARINHPGPPLAQPAGVAEPWGTSDYNSGLFYQQLDGNSKPQFYNQTLPMPSQQQYQIPPEQLNFQSQMMQGGRYEVGNPPLQANQIPVANSNQAPPPNGSANLNQPIPEDRHYLPNVAQTLAPQNQPEPVNQAPKHPNSMLPRSHGSTGDDNVLKENGTSNQTFQRQSSEEVFENEHDDKWKTQPHNIQVRINNKKKTVQRKTSAADEDTDWRRRDGTDGVAPKDALGRTSSLEAESKNSGNNSWSQVEKRERRRDVSDPNITEASKKEEKGLLRKKAGKAGERITSQQRHLTDKRMGNVLSWLQCEQPRAGDTVEREIRKLKITDSEADLTRFIEMTQAFATNESKMREVAEIICNKALKEPRFCRNASVLCDRMSFMMVQGTKFRSVVLNVMQGHYKNREQLYASSYRGDRRWFGFVTFLVEIFLNVRTSNRDRLLVLSTPVFNCLFQVLVGMQIDQEHIECFARLRVGPGLEAESLSRLNELMGEIRDRCVVSKSDYVKRSLLSCVELYASKWTVPS